MAQQNSITNFVSELTIDPGASGDSFVQFDINTTGEFRIGVDDTDDSFRISQGSALGTNDTFIMTAAGENTMPLQPAFLAYNSSTDSNVTGDGTVFTVEYDGETFDQNNDYNTTTDTFTAPVTGRYHFGFSLQVGGAVLAAFTSQLFSIVTSNRTYTSGILDPNRLVSANPTEYIMGFTILADMDAGDTTTTTLSVSGGSKVADVFGSVPASDYKTYFNGYLVC